jgi:DeoR/GlpR family transcriptional regulator of sugar metabolism
MSERGLSILERRTKILTLMQERQRVSIQEICDVFQISEATARRDLDDLDDQGCLKRVHGGAMIVHQIPTEATVLQRAKAQAEAKQRIGQVAVGLIREGDAVFLAGGSTVLEVARYLPVGINITVITNSVIVINALATQQNINLVSIGGVLNQSEQTFIGHLAEQSMSQLRANITFIGIRSVDPIRGLTYDFLLETMTDRAILGVGQRTVLLVDHSKFDTVSASFVAPISAFQTVITDRETPNDYVIALKSQGIEVILA